jgi:DNA repair exonuclease SbcCD ATPase subunit
MNLQELRLKNEITDLRQSKATLEDQLTQANDDLADANSKAAALGALVQQLERARDEALDEQKKLRANLKSTQQSVTQTFRLDGSTNLGHLTSAGGAVDPETAIKLNEAKSEAKLRQMANKLEFMKAQLASEQSSTEELRKQLEASHMKLDELRGMHTHTSITCVYNSCTPFRRFNCLNDLCVSLFYTP